MTGDFDANGTPLSDTAEPGDVVAAMASAVDRLRSAARTVFEGDADLFASTPRTGERAT